MKKFKVGDTIYNKRVELWHDTFQYGNWHQIKKYEKFLIVQFYGNNYSERIEVFNINRNFSVSMPSHYLPEDFYTETEYRKIKLQELNEIEER